MKGAVTPDYLMIKRGIDASVKTRINERRKWKHNGDRLGGRTHIWWEQT